jgi:hypothetical protein
MAQVVSQLKRTSRMNNKFSDEERGIFEEDPEIAIATNALLSVLVGHGRGKIVPWNIVESVVGKNRNGNPEKYIIWKARKRLRNENGIDTDCPPTLGIRLMTPHQQMHDGVIHSLKKAFNQYRKANHAVDVIPSDELTDHEKYVRVRKMAQLDDDVSEARRRLWRFKKQQEPPESGIPLRPIE